MLSTTLVVKDGVNIFGEGPRFPSCRLGDEVLEQGAELKRHLMKATSGAPVVPIGRLDKDSSGLLLLTTEASLISRVLRPRADLGGIAVEKEYHVRTHRLVKDNELECLRSGIDISVRGRIERTRPCQIDRVHGDGAGELAPIALRFVLQQGRNRQIRKMLGAIGHAPEELRRERVGCVRLAGLKAGQVEPLSAHEIRALLGAGHELECD